MSTGAWTAGPRPAALGPRGSGVNECTFGPVTSAFGLKAYRKLMIGPQRYPKAGPETTQKPSKSIPEVPCSKKLLGEGPATHGPPTGAPLYMHKALKYRACRQNRARLPTHQVLLRASCLHTPGARMTVVELIPSNKYKYIYIYIYGSLYGA